jgi:HAD superfamily hydrolase (TIGR01509 family)
MSKIKAVFFDQDGVIVDTERDGHRVSFNRTFAEFGFNVEWDPETYHKLLQVGGGKERMRHAYENGGYGVEVADIEATIRQMHKRKTDIFIEMVENGELPLRPGVHRFMREINQAGLILGICTTSNERAAAAITGGLLKDIQFDFVLAGDVVSRKKPDPEIYLLALQKAGVKPEECLVVEDSHIGVSAAKAAGMHVIATVNGYTREEDTSAADFVVDCLGDPFGEKASVLKGSANVAPGGFVSFQSFEAELEA